MKNLALYFAIGLWAFIIVQALQIQHSDDVIFQAYSAGQHALELEQELKLDAERLQAVDSVAAQIVLDTLKAVQQVKQDVVLDDIYFTANDTLGHLSR